MNTVFLCFINLVLKRRTLHWNKFVTRKTINQNIHFSFLWQRLSSKCSQKHFLFLFWQTWSCFLCTSAFAGASQESTQSRGNDGERDRVTIWKGEKERKGLKSKNSLVTGNANLQGHFLLSQPPLSVPLSRPGLQKQLFFQVFQLFRPFVQKRGKSEQISANCSTIQY